MNWSYISGFFDADGSISLIMPKKNNNKTLYISFHNNEINILDDIKNFILDKLGIKGVIVTKKSDNINHQTAFELRYTHSSALKVCNKMNLIHPKKRHRVKVYNLIQNKTKRNGFYSEDELIDRIKLYEVFFKKV